jgi:hypothetical protein
MKKHGSIVREKILNEFSEIRGRSLMNHVSNSYNIETAIGFASLYCPEVIEIEGCIFIAEFYNGNIDSLKQQHADKKNIEMFVNSWSLSSLLADDEKLNYDINYIDEFAKAIQYFWQLRMNVLFPDKNVVVEIGDGIMGEEGLAITVYQA